MFYCLQIWDACKIMFVLSAIRDFHLEKFRACFFINYLIKQCFRLLPNKAIYPNRVSGDNWIQICRFVTFSVNSSKTLDNLPSLFRSTGGRSTELRARCDSCFNRAKIGRERDVRGHQMCFAFTIANCGKYSKRHRGLSQYDDRCDSLPLCVLSQWSTRSRTNGPISRVLHRIELIRPVASYRRRRRCRSSRVSTSQLI